jgi:hypothetical protein
MHTNRFFDSSSSEENSDDEQEIQVKTTKRNNGQTLATSYIVRNDDAEHGKQSGTKNR